MTGNVTVAFRAASLLQRRNARISEATSFGRDGVFPSAATTGIETGVRGLRVGRLLERFRERLLSLSEPGDNPLYHPVPPVPAAAPVPARYEV